MAQAATAPESDELRHRNPSDAVDTGSAKEAGKDVFGIAKATFKNLGEDQLSRQAAATAYHFLFSVIPLLIFLTALTATISRAVYDGADEAVQNVMDWVFDQLPETTAMAVEEPITNAIQESGGGLISFGAIFAIIGARNAMGSLIDALNAAYRVEETRPFWKKQLLALGLTVATGLSIIVAATIFILGPQIGDLIAGPLGLGDVWSTVWSYAQWPIILVLLLLAVAVLYWAAPNADIPFRWLSPGAAFAVVGWGVVTLGLSTYFRYFGGYAQSYGLLGGVMAFVFWLWIMSFVLLIGGELNATLARRAARSAEATERSEGATGATRDERGRGRVSGPSEQASRAAIARALAAPAAPAPPRPAGQRASGAAKALGISAVAAVVGAIGASRK